MFLSYASQDAEAAQRICKALRTAGIAVWFDQSELRGGDAWDRQIRQQIHDCRLFVPIISAHSEARDEGYFRREWKLAVDRTHDMAERKAFLIPVVIDDTSDHGASVPDKFCEVQWMRLPAGETPAAFIDRVARLLSSDQSSAQAPATRVEPDASLKSKRPEWKGGTCRRWAPALSVTVSAAVVAVGYLAFDRYWLSKRGTAPAQTTGASEPSGVGSTEEKSIAVLPFVDMSEKRDQEYFSDGLSEELIDRLAHKP